MPKPVDDLFKEVKEGNPSYSDEQAWATAWSIYCKNVNPGSDSCHQDEYLTKQASELANGGTSVKVAARYLEAGWEGKLVGKDFRLAWTHDQWTLEELPQKGKRKLRVATVQTNLHYNSSSTNLSGFIPENIIRSMHISTSDTYDHVKEKISQGMANVAEEVITKENAAPGAHPKQWDFLRRISWYERQVYFLEVTPENVDPFHVEGKDFTVSVEWTKWSAYSPDSDLQQSDPHYTRYDGGPTSARKLYKILKEDPGALKSVTWDKFDAWLKEKKIDHKVNFSNWS